MNGRRKGAVDFLTVFRLLLAATDTLQKEVAMAAGLTEPTLTRIFHGQIPLTPELKARLLLALHRDTFDAAPHVVREMYGTAPAALAATGD
jgi:transcriptional regulator with XRE-family HTH domain